MSEEKKPEPAKPVAEAAKPAKKSWSNPALRAMGIPKVSLPSRNWMIFWTVLATVGGSIYYDKHQQKKIREKYMLQVQKLSEEIYSSDRIPRKLSIFIAPPPDDFLEESLKHFRRYIKPVLNAAAIDFVVYTESRQGEIRSQVAEQIRMMRKERLEDQKTKEADALTEAYARSWTKFFKEDVPNVFKKIRFSKEEEPEVFVDRHDLYTPTDVLGLYKVVEPVKAVRDDENTETPGGVVCIGRGAYKEYMFGVHEGLLGPLEKPEEKIEEVVTADENSTEEKKDEPPVVEDFAQKEGEEDKKQDSVPKPYIRQTEYATAELAPELEMGQIVRNDKNVPVLFEQPVYVFPVPRLSGIANWPRKIYRFFTKRELAEAVTSQTLAVVYGNTRPFEFKDRFLAKEEELDWPKKWVERGRGKDSEWVQELEVDNRIGDRLRVFETPK